MANQYTASFDHIIQEKFGKSAKELLMQYVEEKITYDKASKLTGFTTSTIRKWCSRYDIRLLAQSNGKKKKSVENFSLLATRNVFKSQAINMANVLSRQWLIGNHGKTSC